jgi:hypothetical protein
MLVLVAIIGALAYVLITYVPMPPPFRTIIIVFAVVIVVLYLLTAFSLLPPNVLPR